MMTEKKVSIIIPAYNAVSFIDDALLSLDKQTYKNIETIIVDDCSTDSTYEHLIELQKENRYSFPIIVDRMPKNSGHGNARNKGMTLATGQYIMFLDSDDIFESVAVERMVFNIENHDMCICSFYRQRGKRRQMNLFSHLEGEFTVGEFLPKLYSEWPLNWFSCVGTKIYKTELIKAKGIRFNDDDYRYNEDLGFVVDYIRICKNIRVIKDELYCYTYIPGSVQHKKTYAENSIVTVRNSRMNFYNLVNEYSLLDIMSSPFMKSLVDMYFSRLIIHWNSFSQFQEVFSQICDFPEMQGINPKEYSKLKKMFLKMVIAKKVKKAYAFFNVLAYSKNIYTLTKNLIFKVG